MKRLSFFFLTFLLIILIPVGIGEVVTRAVLGNRLIFEVIEQDGFYRFRPSQEGWYLHNIRAPARINNIAARGEDVDLTVFPQVNHYFFLGDSFTFGYALQEKETIPYHFMKEGGLSPTHVINYGNSAFGIYHMIRTYDHHQHWMKPGDTIVMIMIEDDFYRPLKDYQRTKLKDFLWRLRQHSSFFAWMIPAIQQVLGEGASAILTKLKKDYRAAHAQILYSYKRDIFKEDARTLLQFYKRVKQNAQKLIFVFYEYEKSDYSEKAEQFCQRNGLVCVTNIHQWLESVFQKGNSIVCDYDYHHPSLHANQAVGKGLWTFLAKR